MEKQIHCIMCLCFVCNQHRTECASVSCASKHIAQRACAPVRTHAVQVVAPQINISLSNKHYLKGDLIFINEHKRRTLEHKMTPAPHEATENVYAVVLV